MNVRPRTGLVDLSSMGTIVGTLGVTAALYARLPASVPVHFDLHGRADGFAPRGIGAWLLPSIAIVTAAVVRLGPRLMRRRWRERLEGSPTAAVTLVMVLLTCAFQLVILRLALAPQTDAGPLIALVLAVAWIALGQLMPRTRRNPIMGVRTRWTLASDENWARTHRVAGIAFTVGGLLAVIAAAFSVALAIAVILLSGLYPLIWISREKRKAA